MPAMQPASPISSAFSILNSNTVTIDTPTCSEKYVTECPSLSNYIESTLSLISSRGYAGNGDSTRSSEELKSLLSSQTSTGVIPLLRYPEYSTDLSPYLNGSLYPSELGWTNDAFNRSDVDVYVPGSTYVNSDVDCPKNVSMVIGTPWHGVVALENFYFSSQTATDVSDLKTAFDKIYKFHSYIHTKRLPFELNILHPFESSIPLSNPMWEEALEEAIGVYEAEGWTPNPPIPDSLRKLPDFPPNEKVFIASLYLLECLSHYSYSIYEITTSCPFSMIDVGFGSALAASDIALKQISVILKDKNLGVGKDVEGILGGWGKESIRGVEELWEGEGFRNKVSYDANLTRVLEVNVLSDFYAGFGYYSDVRRASEVIEDKEMEGGEVDRLVFGLLDGSGEGSFRCGNWPIPMTGCGGIGRGRDGGIDPVGNWVVARGMEMQGAEGVGHWIRNSTINMVCGAAGGGQSWDDCSELFPRYFNYETGGPLEGVCGNASSVTAASFANLVFQDPVLSFSSAPPLNTTWVLVIIVSELVVAFLIGILCTVFSVTLFKKLRKDKVDVNDDNVFENIRNEQLEQLGLVGWEGNEGERLGEEVEQEGSSWNAIKSFVKVLW
ncbi:hypothetical protein TrVE_jg166 [Triparma verrucosa]|uniref:Uncharacterized protein n=1 Tax=Triparma verrucosa TaxID=1606542 RepID=A0A9W6Z4C5_9STRA|nr:hypothetical protein TrVE_jg166 [Triparma verrucosa]